MNMQMTPRDLPVPADTTPGWYPLYQLDGAFQRFLLDELTAFPTASAVINNQLHVAEELVNLYTAVDIAWA